MNRNVIIAIVAVLGLCVCGGCIAVFGGFALLGPAIGNVLTTVPPLPSPIVAPTFVVPTLPAIPTIPSIPTTSFTPPVILQRGTPTAPVIARGTPTVPSISRGTPTPGAGSTQVIFTDNFSGKCSLPEPDDDKHTFKCESGSYTMLNKTGTSRWVYYTDVEYDDSVIEADAHAVSGPPFVEYGIVFRMTDDGKSFYGFTLTRDGKYTVWRCESPCTDSTDFVDLISYTVSNAVKAGTATNHIKIVAQGNQIAMYVNDQWLNTVTDSTFASGTLGFFLNSRDPNGKAAFDNLTVSQINGRLTLPKGVPTPSPTPK